jgi:hypothetical protein
MLQKINKGGIKGRDALSMMLPPISREEFYEALKRVCDISGKNKIVGQLRGGLDAKEPSSRSSW